MPVSEPFRSRVLEQLRILYDDQAAGVLRRVDELAERYVGRRREAAGALWSERSVFLITYGDQLRCTGQSAFESQKQFLLEHGLDELVNTVHILPFFPYSSDDGFSVIDYRRVDSTFGDWSDVDRLGRSFGLAFDFVINHCSQQNAWFKAYQRGEEPYVDYFIEVDPSTDLSAVTRPRSTPLLTPYRTNRGTKYLWTTFSEDQLDLNFRCPEVLLEALDILLMYVQRGAGVIRLDAIGFLWKKLGTNCMHLPETHAVIKLMRCLVDYIAPGTVLLTETNVPHEENVSYFGDGDEAHMVYQFSLAPLILDAYLTGDGGPLSRWLSELSFPGSGMTFLNFTASHDGIGIRPLEGLVGQERIARLIQSVQSRGGLVSTRVKPDGTESPYELNIAYVSALDLCGGLEPNAHASKFLASQSLMLGLRGVPGIYFHSLVGTRNYLKGVEQTGQARTINRRKFGSAELREILSDENSVERRIFDGYRRILAIRIDQPAFHPDADQAVLETKHASVVALMRTSLDGNQRVLVLANVGEEPVTLDLEPFGCADFQRDLLEGGVVENGKYSLRPNDTAWLV